MDMYGNNMFVSYMFKDIPGEQYRNLWGTILHDFFCNTNKLVMVYQVYTIEYM